VIDAAFPLTPLQQGMLFHHLLDPHAGVDVLQLLCSGSDPVDAGRLREAWNAVAARHELLRTAFRWDGLQRAVGEVAPHVEVPFSELDWRDADPAERDRRRDALLRADRSAGFALGRAPLFRLTLIRTGEHGWELLWTLHHAILDGTGFRIVLAETFRIYEHGTAGLRTPVPFRAHAAWLERAGAGTGAAWWRERLRGFVAPTPVPLARPRDAAVNGAGAEHERVLSPGATAALVAFGNAHRVGIDLLVQAAWAIVLARHAACDDVVFGAVRACRRSSVPDAERIVGLLMNTLPVRVRVDHDAPLVSWLHGLARERAALRPYEHTPLDQVQRWSEVAPPTPLFETLVNVSPATVEAALRAEDPSWERRRVRQIGRTNVPLAVVGWGGETLTLRLQYDDARLTADAVAVLAQQLLSALESLPRATRVGDVALASEAERSALRAANTGPARSEPAAISTTVATHARRAPDAVAVCDGTTTLTYGVLLERADRLAAALRARGVRGGTPVAMTFERSTDALVVLLGILRAGGAYVPLVPELPDARWAQQLTNSGARLAVTTSALRARLPAGIDALAIDRAEEFVVAEPAPPPPEPDLDDDAYILFTSGSTGEPKGVAVAHRNLAAYAAAIVQRLGMRAGDALSFASVSTLAADLGNTSVYAALATGGTLHLIPPETATDPARFGAYAATHPIDVLKITPSHLRALLEGGDAVLPRRWLVLGGEAASPAFADALLASAECRILNHYGPTETTVGACTFMLDRAALDAARAVGAQTIPIGSPLGGVRVSVLDGAGAPVPIGVAGELYIGGAGVARGYVGDATRTAERFIELPGIGRAYRTGDRVRRLPSGDLEFLGRFDRQVKVRGYRVEPAEIEAVLLAHPAISAAAVAVRTDGAEPALDAYVVAADSATDAVALARAHLAARLPAYLVPSRIAALPALPLTPNGKIDRAAHADRTRARGDLARGAGMRGGRA
jgi:amino acid adenylation domain-containing protein